MSMLREHAMQAEAMVLGGILINPNVLGQIDLVAADFVTGNNRQIFQACVDVSRDQPVELITVGQHLERLTGRNWLKSLGELMRNCPSASGATEYAKALREKGRLLRAQELLSEYQGKIASEGLVAIDSLASELLQLGMVGQDNESTLKQMLRAVNDDIEKRLKGDVCAIPTGLTDLDKLIGGFHSTDLVVVGARPSMGKTAFMLNLLAGGGVKSGIISTEQPVVQIGHRIVSREAGVALARMRDPKAGMDGGMEGRHWTMVTGAVERLMSGPGIWVSDQCSPNIADVMRQARKWKQAYGIQALYVDYIQRIRGTDPSMPKFQQVGEVVRGLKDIARELEIPVIALAQVSRKVDERPNKQPHMGDLSDSSEIEKEADLVMTLYRDEVYNPDSNQKGLMEVSVEKNRHGPTDRVRVVWFSEILKVADCSSAYREAV